MMNYKMDKKAYKAVVEAIGEKKAAFVFSKIGHLKYDVLNAKIDDYGWSAETKKVAVRALKPNLIKRIFMSEKAWEKQFLLVEELHGKILKL